MNPWLLVALALVGCLVVMAWDVSQAAERPEWEEPGEHQTDHRG